MGPVAEWLRIAAAARTPEILAPCLYIGFVRRLLGGYGIGHVLRYSKPWTGNEGYAGGEGCAGGTGGKRL
jgi:hypothetical protein